MRYFLFVVFVIFFVFSCSDKSTSKDDVVRILSLEPVKDQTLYPIESSEQVNILITAKTNNEIDNGTLTEWKVEKLKDDIDSSFLIEQKSNENSNSGFIVQKTDKRNQILLIIFEKGYYKVEFSLSNFTNTDIETIYIKNGDNLYKNLYLKLNTPSIEIINNQAKIKGVLSYNLKTEDNTSDRIKSIKTIDLLNDWFDTKDVIDITKNFQITTGILCKIKNDEKQIDINETTKKEITRIENLDNIINMENFVIFNDIVDITEKGEIVLNIKDQIELKSDIFVTVYNWITEDNVKKFKFENFEYSQFPLKIRQNKNSYISKYSIGYMQIYDNNIDNYISFTANGLNSSIIDPKNRRVYPSLPYGYLIAKLGKNGSPFAIGSKFEYRADNLKNIYYNSKNKFVKLK